MLCRTIMPSTLVRTCFSVSVIAMGCGGRIADDSSFGPASNAADDAGIAADTSPLHPSTTNPFHPGEDWFGTYTCPQGLTNLDLRIVSSHDDVIDDALFIFDWQAGGTSGSYHMTGTFDGATNTATFTPTAWIVQPGFNWYMVGMAGTVGGNTYSGNIDGTSCGTFDVTR